ncbi:hypothetical protein BT96DRAFT_836190, partial [Gymnopus androsaceus JB14]
RVDTIELHYGDWNYRKLMGMGTCSLLLFSALQVSDWCLSSLSAAERATDCQNCLH